jgi:hypothetical protein
MDNDALKVLGVSIAYTFGAVVAISVIALMFYTPEFFK